MHARAQWGRFFGGCAWGACSIAAVSERIIAAGVPAAARPDGRAARPCACMQMPARQWHEA
ncbi:hypothetical protein EON67_03760 [archaeon]|nr:MAG: hypothetical protein EON67_03760 [archaeon]